jgi:lipopolysaccharide transport system ATP-binding protein
VNPGEVVGLIGRNGAGKSTLLKILSKITDPTEGEIALRGTVSSLLEVGTGFHPELTGRENIFLNGAILGMRRDEIRARFDEIVDFSGVAKFIDTPVKHYSSGMYTRLAFSVAAHLETEILLVDEVLAVGDAQFQRKCLGRMGEIAKGGRTVIFVSHNMSALRSLCTHAVWLEGGTVARTGGTEEVMAAYQDSIEERGDSASLDLSRWSNRYGSGETRVVEAILRSEDGQPARMLRYLEPAVLEFTLDSQFPEELTLSAICMTREGVKVLQLVHHDTPGFTPGIVHGRRRVSVAIPSLPLQCGDYMWAIGVHGPGLSPVDVVLEILPFSVVENPARGHRPFPSHQRNGLCTLLAEWRFVEP